MMGTPPPGSRTAQLRALIGQRARASPDRRQRIDAMAKTTLFRPRAIVFTDTADFTLRTAKDGILHFLMVFDRALSSLRKAIERSGGDLVKVEGDSLLLRYDDANLACTGVEQMEIALRIHNLGRPPNEQIRFSYGVGFGDVLDLEDDLFGLEVNLASKLGEDLAEPGQALLTPNAAAGLNPVMLKKVVPHQIVTFGNQAIPVHRLRLPRTAARPQGTRTEDTRALVRPRRTR